jgi:hypothetical protein
MNLTIDFAELNAPPMINYGVVYPQAILIFVITTLYSVVYPLIVIFGAIYFGMAYVVYKYKLLFGQFFVSFPFHHKAFTDILSLLQTIRISGSGLAHHIRSLDLGGGNLLGVYDGFLHPEESICDVRSSCTTSCGHVALVVVHR